MFANYRLIDASAGLASLERNTCLSTTKLSYKMIAHSSLYSLLVGVEVHVVAFTAECSLEFNGRSHGRLGSVVVGTEMSVSRAAVGKTGLMLGPRSMSSTT